MRAKIFVQALESWIATKIEPVNQRHVMYIEKGVFSNITGIFITYAVLQNVGNINVLSSEIGWGDIGSWRSMDELVVPDAKGNRLLDDAVL